jgi:hypothetical protein
MTSDAPDIKKYVHVLRYECLQTKIFLSAIFWKKYSRDANYIAERSYLMKNGEAVYTTWYNSTTFKDQIHAEVQDIAQKIHDIFFNSYSIITESLLCLECSSSSAAESVARFLLQNYGIESTTVSADVSTRRVTITG